MPAAWEYESAVNNVSNWYNTSADNVWNVINDYNLSPAQTQDLIPTVDSFLYGQGANSGYTAVKAADGSVLSWNNVAALQSNSANAIEQAVNSNAGTISQKIYQLPASTDYSGTGGTFKGIKGLLNTPVNKPTIMSQVSTGIAAAGLGITLGKVFDKGLYTIHNAIWDNDDLWALNPDTWNSLTVDMSDSGWEGTLKRAFNAVFGIDPSTGKSQMYIDADAAAYLAQYMQEQGIFNRGEQKVNWPADVQNPPTLSPAPPYNVGGTTTFRRPSKPFPNYTATFLNRGCIFRANASEGNVQVIGITPEANGQYLLIQGRNEDTGALWNPQYYSAAHEFTYQGKTVYYGTNSFSGYPAYDSGAINISSRPTVSYVAWLLQYGNISGGTTIEGISDQDGATTPDFSNCQTPADYKQALQQQYPDLFQNAITQNVAQPNGTVVQRVYIPVGTPTATGAQDTQPTTDPTDQGQSQSETEIDPAQATQTIIETLTKYIENIRTPDTPDTPNPPDTGDGNTPPVVPPTGSASALWSVYNPSQTQLNSFGAWLWSSNFIDQVLKLFNNPMQAIIGVHKIFASPTISGSGSIVVGYLDSGVAANIVGAQYTTIDCGSVSVHEQFGNVFDYTDTQVRLYLPFIGIVDLDTSDVMRSTVSVVYHVDVITGACLAEVRVTRDGSGGTLYQFAGDAAVRYPISSGSYMGIVAGIASAVGGIASAIMTGGATLPMAAGAIAGGMSGAKTQVQHSGNFSGNAGAMGAKKPYLIIERPQTVIADGYGNYQGKGANVIRTVAQCSGYFKLADVHTDSIAGASAAEVQAIRTALENGVIK